MVSIRSRFVLVEKERRKQDEKGKEETSGGKKPRINNGIEDIVI